MLIVFVAGECSLSKQQRVHGRLGQLKEIAGFLISGHHGSVLYWGFCCLWE